MPVTAVMLWLVTITMSMAVNAGSARMSLTLPGGNHG